MKCGDVNSFIISTITEVMKKCLETSYFMSDKMNGIEIKMKVISNTRAKLASEGISLSKYYSGITDVIGQVECELLKDEHYGPMLFECVRDSEIPFKHPYLIQMLSDKSVMHDIIYYDPDLPTMCLEDLTLDEVESSLDVNSMITKSEWLYNEVSDAVKYISISSNFNQDLESLVINDVVSYIKDGYENIYSDDVDKLLIDMNHLIYDNVEELVKNLSFMSSEDADFQLMLKVDQDFGSLYTNSFVLSEYLDTQTESKYYSVILGLTNICKHALFESLVTVIREINPENEEQRDVLEFIMLDIIKYYIINKKA